MRQPPSIEAFGGGGFRVSGAWRPGSLLVLDDAPSDWAARSIETLRVEDFAEIIAAGRAVSEFVLLGTGRDQSLPPRIVREALRAAGLGLEFMSSDAAAHTHNVLVSEGRRFATALIAV